MNLTKTPLASLLAVGSLVLTIGCARTGAEESAPAEAVAREVAATPLVDVTGTWVTERPASYLIEATPELSLGSEVEHEIADLLERTATLEWELEQRADGLVVGTNHWAAVEGAGAEGYSESEPMIGTYDGETLILVEASHDNTPEVRFELRADGTDRLIGVAHGAERLMAMRFVMVRAD